MDAAKCKMMIDRIRMDLDTLEGSLGETEEGDTEGSDEEIGNEAPEESASPSGAKPKLAAMILLAKKRMGK